MSNDTRISQIARLLDSLRIYGNQKETEAAELLGVSLSTWKKWVSGKEHVPNWVLKNYLAFCGFDYGRTSMKEILDHIQETQNQVLTSSTPNHPPSQTPTMRS